MTRLVIGPPNGEHLALVLPAGAPPREGWLDATAEVRVYGFEGAVEVYLEVGDIARFAAGLEHLHAELTGEAALETREGQIAIKCRGNGRGTITVEGVLYARATFGSRLEFSFDTDQTYLPEPLQVARDFVASHS